MNTTRDMLITYFSSFFTTSEKDNFLLSLNCVENEKYSYKNDNIEDWMNVENTFKATLPYGNLNDFHIEVNKNATCFINQLFNKHVNNDTFIITVLEHNSLIQNTENITNNKFILRYDDTVCFDYNKIIDAFKNSKCTKIFIYCAGIINSRIVSQDFYYGLKESLVKNNIPCVMALDEVQSMFFVPRDYSIFDYVIFTCHSLLPHYNSGILLSKTNENMGFKDIKVLDNFLKALNVTVLNKKDKFFLFKFMLEQYFSKELQYSDLFYVPSNTSWNVFFLYIKDKTLIDKVINKYKDVLNEYWIQFNNDTIMIKSNFILQLDLNLIIEGLDKLKSILNKCIKLKERLS